MATIPAEIPSKPVCRPKHFGRILKSDHSGRIFKLLPFKRPHKGARQVNALSEMNVGERGILVSLDLPESVQNHLMHMGFVPGSCVITLRRAPAGDPTVYGIDGMEIALRRETAGAIRVRACSAGASANSEPTAHASDSASVDTPQLAEASR
jgi:ferrous iron transport protein A